MAKKFNRGLSLKLDGLHSRLDALKSTPNTEAKRKAIAELRRKIAAAERKVPS